MPSSYSDNLRLELPANGEQTGTWGNTVNNNLGTLLEEAITGVKRITITGNYTLTTANGSTDDARHAVLIFEGVLTGAAQITIPSKEKVYIVRNGTTGGYALTIKTAAGSGYVVQYNATEVLYCDGSSVFNAHQPGTGSLSAPALSFNGNSGTGFYVNQASTELNVAIANIQALNISTVQSSFSTKVVTPTSGSSYAGFNMPHGTAPTLPTNGDMWTTNSGAYVQINGTTQTYAFANNAIPIAFANGTAASPSITFSAQTGTGIFYGGSSSVAVSTAGTERMRWNSSGVTYTVPMLAPAGLATAPSYSFAASTGTGMYLSGANEIAFATSGVQRANISDARFNVTGEVNAGAVRVTTGTASTSFKPSVELYDGSTDQSYYMINGDSNWKLRFNSWSGGYAATAIEVGWAFNVAGTYYMNVQMPGVYQATTLDTTYVSIDSSGFIRRYVSAKKYKKDIESYTSGLDSVKLLRPVTYRAIQPADGQDPDQRYVGFIADEAAESGLEEFVLRDPVSGEIEGFRYAQLTTLLVNAVKELSSKVDSLQAEVLALKGST